MITQILISLLSLLPQQGGGGIGIDPQWPDLSNPYSDCDRTPDLPTLPECPPWCSMDVDCARTALAEYYEDMESACWGAFNAHSDAQTSLVDCYFSAISDYEGCKLAPNPSLPLCRLNFYVSWERCVDTYDQTVASIANDYGQAVSAIRARLSAAIARCCECE